MRRRAVRELTGRVRRALPLALAGLALSACAATAVALAVSGGEPGGPARLVGRFVWTSDLPGFGGLSAIEVGPDGLDATLVGDRATILRARLARDASGAVTAAEVTAAPLALVGADGQVLRGLDGDSEGLAVDAAGQAWVSFEGHAAVRRLDGPGHRSAMLPVAPAWAALPINRALEALAVDAGGALYAIPEQPEDGAFPVWRLAPGATTWEVAFRLPRRDGFRVTGADIGPDGRLTVLERVFTGLSFRSRVRRVALDGGGEATLWTSAAGEFDNLEGIAVWRDETGAYGGGLRATMVSDDNFRFFQQTQLVDLALPD